MNLWMEAPENRHLYKNNQHRKTHQLYQWRIQDFPNGGALFCHKWGAHILFSGKKCMKLKEIGLKWGGARLLAPCYSKITIFLWIILNSIMKTSYFTYFENNLLKRPPGSLGAMVLLQNCSFDT